MTTHAADTFTRTHASSWGTADTGGAWSTEAGTGGAGSDLVYSTTGTVGQVAYVPGEDGTTQGKYVRLGSTGVGNREIRFRARNDGTSVGSHKNLEINLKRSNAFGTNRTAIACRFGINQVGSGNDKCVTQHSSYSLGTGGSFDGGAHVWPASSANQWMWCAVQIQGINPCYVRSKIWAEGTQEPPWKVGSTVLSQWNSSESSDQAEAIQMVIDTNDGDTWQIDDLTIVSIDTTLPFVAGATGVGAPAQLEETVPLNTQLFLSIARNDGTTIATPSGWTQVGATTVDGTRALAMFTKTSDGTETEAGLSGNYTNLFLAFAQVAPLVLASSNDAEVTDTSYGQTLSIPAGQDEILLVAAEAADTTSGSVTPSAGVTELYETFNVGDISPLHWMGFKVVQNPSTSEAITATGPNVKHRGHAFAFGKVAPIPTHMIGSAL